MKALNLYPMARLLFPFMGGIVTAPILLFSIDLWIIILCSLFLFFILWLFVLKKFRDYRRRWVNGFLITSLFFSLGVLGFWINSPLNRENHYTKYESSNAYLIEINSSFSETAKTYKTTGLIKAVFVPKDSSWRATTGEILLYFQKQDSFSMNYGDEIISTSKLIPIQGAQNPYAFDYSQYMQRKGIFDQSFIKENDWKIVSSNRTLSLQSLAINLRIKLLSILNDLHYDKESLALAAALLIGYDEYLDDDLRAKFSGSGAMHILCVSGLHVGIIFMLCNILFGFLDKIKFGDQLKIVLILTIIWFYALITGLSPSVMRASTMFTFIVLGKSYNRQGNTYNSLAASALLLLLIDPKLIYNIGFQLSYGAVFAILYIQPKLYRILYFKNVLLSKIWALLCVSIAAQMGTFPLAVYYFHQFPNYFLITNLWVIPLAFVVVSGGIFVLGIGIFGLSTSVFGVLASTLLNYSLICLNKGVEIINRLPFAVSENLSLSKFEVLLFYSFLFASCTLLLHKKRNWIVPLLTFALLLIASSIYLDSRTLKSDAWIVYRVSGYSAMDFISRQKSVLLGDSAFVFDKKKHKFILDENHIKNGVKEGRSIHKIKMDSLNLGYVTFHEDIILFQSLRILYLDQAEKNQLVEKALPIDYVVIAKNAKVNLSQLQKQYDFRSLIFDSSNSWWQLKRLKDEADRLDIPYWDVNEKGAFVFSNKKTPEKFQRVSALGNLKS